MKQADATDKTRRNLLLALGVGSIGAAAAAAPLLKLNLAKKSGKKNLSWWVRTFSSLEHGGVSEWQNVVGQTFSIEGEHGPVRATLSGVKLLSSKGARPASVGRKQAFALQFQTAVGQAPAGDRTYRVTHSAFPPLDMFLDAPTAMARGMKLTAVFN
ncbi:MAG TPA: hypothetical protein VGB70_11030 [Allosphingosinicella sp.]|jgi:hypothetical protein